MTTYLKFPDEQTAQQVLAQWYVDRDITEIRETGGTTIDYTYEMVDADGDVERYYSLHELTEEEMVDLISDPDDEFVSMKLVGTRELPAVETVFVRTEQYWITSSHAHALDIIGTIYKPTGTMLQTEEGDFPETAPIPGWHCNLIGELPVEAEPYVVTPANPVRTY